MHVLANESKTNVGKYVYISCIHTDYLINSILAISLQLDKKKYWKSWDYQYHFTLVSRIAIVQMNG
jgi:hypothetical protein